MYPSCIIGFKSGMQKRKLSSSPASEKSITDFSNSASYFSKTEEEFLKIRIERKHASESLFSNVNQIEESNGAAKHLELERFGRNEIITFVSRNYPDLSKQQKIFIKRLKSVLINNSINVNQRIEEYIQQLVDMFLMECDLEDGLSLEMGPCRLSLIIGDNEFSAYADKQGTKNGEVIWILEESKHVNDTRYKQGDIQLVCSMIAAFQKNISKLEDFDEIPKTIYGIKVVGDKFYFYRTDPSQEYIDQLYSGIVKSGINVIKYPAKGLSLSNPVERKEIIQLIAKLRSYAISI